MPCHLYTSRVIAAPRILLLSLVIFTCHGTIETGGEQVSPPPATSTNISFIYNGIDTLFSRHVTTDRGLVDYEACRSDELLQRVVDTVEAFDLSSLPGRRDSLAFMINAYNILVIYHLPYTTDKIPGSFFDRSFAIAGTVMSLNDLEKDDPAYIVSFNEPRTHFVLSCAALSCPPLYHKAYRANTLYEDMDRRTVSFVNDARFNTIPDTDATVQVSQLFQWYENDFTDMVRDTSVAALIAHTPGADLKDFIASYLTNRQKIDALRTMPLTFSVYDWSVNRQ